MNFVESPNVGVLVDLGLLRVTGGGVVPAWMPDSPLARATGLASRITNTIDPRSVAICGAWSAWVWTGAHAPLSRRIGVLSTVKFYGAKDIFLAGQSRSDLHIQIGPTWCTSPEYTALQLGSGCDLEYTDMVALRDLVASGVTEHSIDLLSRRVPPAVAAQTVRAKALIAQISRGDRQTTRSG